MMELMMFIIGANGQRIRFKNKTKNLFIFLFLFVFSLFGSVNGIECQEPDTLIQRLMGEISDSLYAKSIQSLQDFHTRYEMSDSIGPAGQWIYDQFIDMGYTDVEFDSFTWEPQGMDSSIVSRNIIAIKPGNTETDSLIILGGHYDSINDYLSHKDPNAPAPGANDNATGIAGVLEIARLLEPYSFEKTMMFVCFAGEEEGMGGSAHFGYDIYQQGIPIRLSIILDMIGYLEPFIYDVNIDANVDYIDDALRTAEYAWTYDLWLSPRLTFEYYASDHWRLGTWGPALLIIEDAQYPLIHSEWDVLDSLDIPFATEILKMALASVVDIANYVTVGIKTSDRNGGAGIPKNFVLKQNHPNPFNPSTTISFDVLGTVGAKQVVNLAIYDLRGRRIRTLINSELELGSHKLHWDGRNDRGEGVASGIYLYTLKAGDERFTRKMTMLK